MTVDEDDGTATFTVSLSNPIDIDVDVDVSYGSGSATGGGVDYDDSVDTVTFLANTTTPQTVTVSINNDGLVEATETFVASLSTTTNLGGRNVNFVDTGVGTINDNDSATLLIDDVSVNENAGTAIFTVSLSDPIDIGIDVGVNYSNVTASGTDYDGASDTVSFTGAAPLRNKSASRSMKITLLKRPKRSWRA